MQEYICKLPVPFKTQMQIDGKFQHIEIDTLYFKEPTARHCYIELKKIKGFITKAILSIPQTQKEFQKDTSTEEAKNISASQILDIIALDEVVCEKFYSSIQHLFTTGLVFIDIEQKQSLSKKDIDLMSNDSLDTLTTSYLDFFSQYFISGK